jgi:2-dehydro-3-deoxyphosphogluconate aldolase/(4S)-4-hydroxy-2-oxoglutarate aldolase
MVDPSLARIRDAGIVPVIKLDDPGKAVPLGKALLAGGIEVAEVTFRTDSATESIARLRAELPAMLTGAGTVTTTQQAEAAIKAGASFVVSPSFNEAVVDFCLERGVPILPGVNGPEGVERGLAKGLEVLKFFPSEASGGIPMLDALRGPYASVSYVPTGGVGLANIGAYARCKAVWAIGGSWMAKQEAIAADDWPTITRLARESVLALHGFSIAHVGMNMADEAAARGAVSTLADLFGLASREGASSFMVGDAELEITKRPFPGAHGHLAIRANDVERAVAYLAAAGVAAAMDTAKYEQGRMKSVYVGAEPGGFALHLLRA